MHQVNFSSVLCMFDRRSIFHYATGFFAYAVYVWLLPSISPITAAMIFLALHSAYEIKEMYGLSKKDGSYSFGDQISAMAGFYTGYLVGLRGYQPYIIWPLLAARVIVALNTPGDFILHYHP